MGKFTHEQLTELVRINKLEERKEGNGMYLIECRKRHEPEGTTVRQYDCAGIGFKKSDAFRIFKRECETGEWDTVHIFDIAKGDSHGDWYNTQKTT